VRVILSIPIKPQLDDHLEWHPEPKGIFTVRSAYKLQVWSSSDQLLTGSSEENVEKTEAEQVWTMLWKLSCPPKVHHFLWRFSHNSLPLRMNIAHRGVDLDTRCAVCNRLFEDGVHLFLRCSAVKTLWRVLELEDVRSELLNSVSPIELLKCVFALPKEKSMLVISLL
jgi:hypothetical protein